MNFSNRLREIAGRDADALVAAEKNYGHSWRRRGGVGAFMMLARKWDRLETALRPSDSNPSVANGSSTNPAEQKVAPWDIFGAYRADRREEGILDDIRDLRRYLMLVEEFVTRGDLTVEEGPAPAGMVHTEIEDTETQTMREHVAVDRPPMFSRYPIRATMNEFTNLSDRTILHGSMSGSRAGCLYGKSYDGIHPYTMAKEYVEEYGR